MSNLNQLVALKAAFDLLDANEHGSARDIIGSVASHVQGLSLAEIRIKAQIAIDLMDDSGELHLSSTNARYLAGSVISDLTRI